MVSLGQVKSGLSQYIDQDILPGLSGINRFGASVYLALMLDGSEEKLKAILQKPSLVMLDIVDNSGYIDIDRLRVAALNSFDSSDKLEIVFPVIGKITFHRQDVEKLYQLINR